MPDLHPILVAALTGFVSGLLLSIPVGPINLTIINEGARRGFFWAAMIGLGASVMEMIYCAIAFTSISSFLENRVIKASMEVFSFVFMFYLGMKFLLAKSVSAPTHLLPASSRLEERLEERIEEKLHPHSAFMTGVVRVMGNLGVLLFWILLAGHFMSRDWVEPNWPSKFACVGGVAFGTGFWFTGLSWAVSLGHRKFSVTTLLRIERGSGIGLLVLALIHGGHIAWQLAKHKM